MERQHPAVAPRVAARAALGNALLIQGYQALGRQTALRAQQVRSPPPPVRTIHIAVLSVLSVNIEILRIMSAKRVLQGHGPLRRRLKEVVLCARQGNSETL